METRADMVFTALSSAEVGQVLDDLEKKVERTPSVATNPVFVGMVRLALTASGHAKRGVQTLHPPLLPLPAPVPLPVPVLTAQERSLQESVEECMAIMRKQGMTLDMAVVRRLRATLDEVSPDLGALETRETLERRLREASAHERGLLASAANSKVLMESAQSALRDAERDNTALREQHALATRNAEEFKKRLQTEQEESARLRLEGETSKSTTRKIVLESVLRILRTLEWSSKSTQYTVRSTGKPVTCCPSCGGLNPDGLATGKNTGHQKGCLVAKLILETTSSG